VSGDSDTGYEILSIDDLERLPTTQGSQLLLPLRRTVGFRPFGLNVWVGAQPGDHVIERHREPDGDEELYVVLRGTAQFTLADDTFEAPTGTLVHAPPNTLREATALEAETTVLALGAKTGEAFTPSTWEDFYVAYAYARRGEPERGRAELQATLERDPDAWEGWYNAACFEALAGETDAALDYLRRAVERDRTAVSKYAPKDTDFDSLREDPRFTEILSAP
jgi:tetratricopeptide (TPR) repeat protein